MRLLPLFFLASMGCTLNFAGGVGDKADDPDEVDDGDDNDAQEEWNKADDDGDGLTNGDETELGTDPSEVDSDGDGYPDNAEVDAGSDPTDEEDGVYIGGWPYQSDKESFEGDNGRRLRVGNVFPRFVLMDQYGQDVDLYDFAGHGKPIVMDLSGIWCYWCQELAKLIEDKRSELKGYGFDDIGQQIADGEFYYITILDADAQYNPPDLEDLQEWHDDYPNEYIPVLGDPEGEVTAYANPAGYPTLWILDENMNVIQYNSSDYTEALTVCAERSWDDL